MSLSYDEITFETDVSPIDGFEQVLYAYDADGDRVATFYGEWSKSQLTQAICLAEHYYELGRKTGASLKAAEIRHALEL